MIEENVYQVYKGLPVRHVGEIRLGYPFKTFAELVTEPLSNYMTCSHWGLFKHDYSADFD